MDFLIINGTTVPVRLQLPSVDVTNLETERRVLGGLFRSAVTDTRGSFEGWELETPRLLLAAAQAVESLLKGAGLVTITGGVVGGATIEAFVRGVRLIPYTSTRARVAWTLIEA